MKLDIFTDGGSRGNPGPGGIGIAVFNRELNQEIYSHAAFIGHTTNNEAEYRAFITSAKWLEEFAHIANHHVEEATWYLDSKLVVEQLNKRWKVKEARIKELVAEANAVLTRFSLAAPGSFLRYEIRYVPREKNFWADELVNQALDLHT